MKKLGKNRDDQKRSNWGLVLKLVATGRCSSRIDLSKATGLTKPTISQIVGEMINKNLMAESEKEIRSEIGRHPTKIVISPRAPKVIGVLIDRRYCAAVLCDLNLRVIRREEDWRECR
ncbi:MAG: ROK family protein, partial [Lachnospiraceae bacterium]|nr:ROK family protein [Lachnospiraceae bacterium]